VWRSFAAGQRGRRASMAESSWLCRSRARRRWGRMARRGGEDGPSGGDAGSGGGGGGGRLHRPRPARASRRRLVRVRHQGPPRRGCRGQVSRCWGRGRRGVPGPGRRSRGPPRRHLVRIGREGLGEIERREREWEGGESVRTDLSCWIQYRTVERFWGDVAGLPSREGPAAY
jgi:hypothetical protein